MSDDQHEPESVSAICARLKLLRLSLEMSQQQMAASLGIASQQAYQHYETGKRSLDYTVALDIARIHKVSLDWIYRGMPDMLPVHVAERLKEAEAKKAIRRPRAVSA